MLGLCEVETQLKLWEEDHHAIEGVTRGNSWSHYSCSSILKPFNVIKHSKTVSRILMPICIIRHKYLFSFWQISQYRFMHHQIFLQWKYWSSFYFEHSLQFYLICLMMSCSARCLFCGVTEWIPWWQLEEICKAELFWSKWTFFVSTLVWSSSHYCNHHLDKYSLFHVLPNS